MKMITMMTNTVIVMMLMVMVSWSKDQGGIVFTMNMRMIGMKILSRILVAMKGKEYWKGLPRGSKTFSWTIFMRELYQKRSSRKHSKPGQRDSLTGKIIGPSYFQHWRGTWHAANWSWWCCMEFYNSSGWPQVVFVFRNENVKGYSTAPYNYS